MLPNFLVILADDLDVPTWDAVPALRAPLEAAGTTFTSAFVDVSLCCPSRATLLRGQYAQNHHIFGNHPPSGGWQMFHERGEEASTVATWLQAAGYHTGLFGKYLNGYAGAEEPPGWTRWVAGASESAYRGYDYRLAVDGTVVAHGDTPADYLDHVTADAADEFIRNVPADAPFFALLTPYAVHQPATPPPGDTLPDAVAPRSPAYDEADVSDKPPWVPRLHLSAKEIEDIDHFQRRRVSTALDLAGTIQRLLATLAETGRLSNTYVVFTSDNGFHLGTHRLPPGKQTPYEEDIRVPFVVRGPGVPAGARVDALVENVDLAPTLAALAGVTPPAWVDGRDLSPWLRGETPAPWRAAALLQHGGRAFSTGEHDAKVGVPPTFRGLRTADRLYVEYRGGWRELYDLIADPWELRNLATDPARADEIRRLSLWLGELDGCAGADCRRAEEAPREATGSPGR